MKEVKNRISKRRLFGAEEVIFIRDCHKKGVSIRELASLLNASPSAISNIVKFITYKEVGEKC